MDSKVGDDRFDRYYRRMQLGLRLLSHGARPQTATEWSGLTPDRLVTLKRRWLPEVADGFRGPAPTSFQTFFRSTQRASMATMLASIHQVLCQGSASQDTLAPSLESGERLCKAYEIFLSWEPDSDIEFDHAVLLVRGVAMGTDIQLRPCPTCQRAALIDKCARRQKSCTACREP